MRGELDERQEQKRSNNDIRKGYKKMNLAFVEYKAALEAVKSKIITAGR